eukprot:COSAG06_NODE_1118_length_10635_cov_5.052946_10_plen_112_part_00
MMLMLMLMLLAVAVVVAVATVMRVAESQRQAGRVIGRCLPAVAFSLFAAARRSRRQSRRQPARAAALVAEADAVIPLPSSVLCNTRDGGDRQYAHGPFTDGLSAGRGQRYE